MVNRNRIKRNEVEEEEWKRMQEEKNAAKQRACRERKRNRENNGSRAVGEVQDQIHSHQFAVSENHSIVFNIPSTSGAQNSNSSSTDSTNCDAIKNKKQIVQEVLNRGEKRKRTEKIVDTKEYQINNRQKSSNTPHALLQANSKSHVNRVVHIFDSPQILKLSSDRVNDIPSSNNQIREQPLTYMTPRRIREMRLADVNEHYIGSMTVLCEHCGAKHFAAERVANKKNSFNDCCSHGKVKLDPLPLPPQIILSLLNRTHELSTHFHQKIRCYNNSFAYASFNANLVNFNNTRPGPYCFKIHGQIYYQINTSLYPATDESPSYGQLFIVDQNEATDIRLQQNSNLNTEILRVIDNVMRECNPFAQAFQTMNDEIQELMKSSKTHIEPELKMVFSTRKSGTDRGRYNEQRINEVAAIFSTTADGDIPESYVTIRNKQTKSLQYVISMDPNVEPWIYPLFYPFGTRGWSEDLLRVNSSRRITRNAYLKFRMAVRDDNIILMGGRLFQQWVVDNYVKMEKDRIFYDKSHQKQLRADSYQGLMTHLQNRATNEKGQIGKLIILPSTFIGSPRYMLQNYQDAMAIVTKYGKPDLFITMTCNPHWREIKENLSPGQTASDRPDIVSRVFDLKKDQLIHYIVDEKLFGEVSAFVYVIEYQKRGLPHVHVLVTLKHKDKITTPDVVNKYISAEIPNKTENPKLHNIVMTNMIHGTCGSWCLDETGKCTKKYPKEFRDETTMDENGYPYYRRRDTGSFVRSNGIKVDNRNVVPYNTILLLLLNCHINVEVVSSIQAVKYLYKYVYKGFSAALVSIITGDPGAFTIDHDEIQNFIETRYVGPVEAASRILNQHLQKKSHSITRLPVHLENQQNVTIDDNDDDDRIRTALEKQTMLIEYFALNVRDPNARKLFYSDIPSYYTFKKKTDGSYVWEVRKRQFNVIGRMYSISPTQIELFHLRLLLISVKGATSFDHLRTVNGKTYNTYQETCLALGLIEDDSEWKRAMEEGEIWMMPRQLRNLFVRILLHCQPNHPKELWESFRDAMSDDFMKNERREVAHSKAYHVINNLLSHEGSDLSAFPSMEQLNLIDNNLHNNENYVTDAQLDNHNTLGRILYDKLNKIQKEIVDRIINAVTTESTPMKCFYIDGPGGSGKTFIYTSLFYLLKTLGKKICTMAFTGIAAILLPNGKTVHKTFGMPVPLFSDSTSNIKCQSKEASYLKSIDIFIWDEAPMAPRYSLELVDRTLRDLMNSDLPFGGKIMVLGGDFRQLLPVKKHATRSEMVTLSIKFSLLWKNFTKFSLTKNMRTLPEEAEFAQFLLSVGDGKLNDDNDNIQLPERSIANRHEDIVKTMFEEIIRKCQYAAMSKIAILAARNVDVDEINSKVVELLDKKTERIYTSVDSLNNCDNGDITNAILPEYLNTLNPSNLPAYELKLRVNCIVMLIRNLSINEGLCNGTRLQILELANNLSRCKILTGDKAGEIVFIHRITLYCENVYPFTLKRRQFPIKLAFAMTINKSQGQTFDKIAVDLRKDVFNHGQLYVALSRVRSWNSLRIFLGNQRTNNIVKNYVYRELYD